MIIEVRSRKSEVGCLLEIVKDGSQSNLPSDSLVIFLLTYGAAKVE
ncbi:MAG TPA: hypothetical protein GXX19_10570 [Syntrophomonadaceae bacterium]|nr:hypothetical protein [Syntrophomonadaceae bacterium]